MILRAAAISVLQNQRKINSFLGQLESVGKQKYISPKNGDLGKTLFFSIDNGVIVENKSDWLTDCCQKKTVSLGDTFLDAI